MTWDLLMEIARQERRRVVVNTVLRIIFGTALTLAAIKYIFWG